MSQQLRSLPAHYHSLQCLSAAVEVQYSWSGFQVTSRKWKVQLSRSSHLTCVSFSSHLHRPLTVVMAWHKGTWWPLFVKEWYGPRCSQHMFDPYSFCLVVLGLALHLLWGTDNIGNWIFGFVAAVLVELVWELIGNSNFILKRIKNNSGTSGEYNGRAEKSQYSQQ